MAGSPSLRIAVASSGLGHVSRGVEAWAAYLGRELHRRGERVLLFKGAGEAAEPFERVVPCLRRAEPRMHQVRRWLRPSWSWRLGLGSNYDVEQATFAKGLIGALRREPCDVLHVQDPLAALWLQRAGSLGLHRAAVILGHGTEESAGFIGKLRFLHELTPWTADQAKAAGRWRETWRVIPNFVDTDRFRPGDRAAARQALGLPPDGVILLCAAAIKRVHKRIDYLIDEVAAALAADPASPLRLVVAGAQGNESPGLFEHGRARLGDRITFLPNHPLDRMPELYRAADMFTLASLREMMPVALLEALATGLPAVTHAHPSMQWMVGPGGVTPDLSQPGALAAAVTEWCRRPAERARLGELARAHCEAHFATDRVVDQYLEYYRDIALNGGRPRAAAA